MHANNGPTIVFDNFPPVPSYVRVMEFSVTDRSVNFEHLCKICSSSCHLQSYLRLHKVLFNFHRRCERCDNGVINLRRDSSTCDGQVWRCSNKKCNFKQSIRAHSFFSGSHLSLHLIVKVVYFWAHQYPQHIVIHETGISEKKLLLISITFVERFVQLF